MLAIFKANIALCCLSVSILYSKRRHTRLARSSGPSHPVAVSGVSTGRQIGLIPLAALGRTRLASTDVAATTEAAVAGHRRRELVEYAILDVAHRQDGCAVPTSAAREAASRP